MTIRRAELADKEAVFELLTELKRSGYAEMGVPFKGLEITEATETLFKDCLDNDQVQILVVEDEDKIVGLCVAYEAPKIIEGRYRMIIEEMVIAPSARNQGIGSQLLSKVESIARDRKIKHIKVATGTELKANKFYQKRGYRHFENTYRKEVAEK